MKSKLMPFAACCLLYAICTGQWSNPVPLLHGSPSITGQSLVAGAGDTMWAAVVTGHSGSSGPYQVLASWTTGDTWSLPAELTPPDSGRIFSEPGMGRDAAGRLWVAWYRGDYPTKDDDSSAVWTAFRDSTGWHPPARVCSGVPAAGPMSFASDAAGDWYLGFATLTPYSSAVYCRMDGDSWLPPQYIAQGVGHPIETNFPAPILVARPDSGLWVVYEICIPSDSFAMLAILQDDSPRWCWYGQGYWPAATADSSGRLWIVQSLLGGFLLQSAVIEDSVEVQNDLVSEYSVGRGRITTDLEGILWAAWQTRSSGWVAVNYSTGGYWSDPEQTSAVTGVPTGIATDANGRVYVLVRTTAGQLHSVYRTARPGVQERRPSSAAGTRLPTVVRGVLFLPHSHFALHSSLFSLSGQRVMSLRPGPNDVSRLAPGVYFVRERLAVGGGRSAVHKVVLTE